MSEIELLISAEAISCRVRELGAQLTHDYAGIEVLVVGVLKGAWLFTADLVRAMEGPLEVDGIEVSSYGGATASSGVVRLVKDLDAPIAGRHVLLVEDIIDSGLTLQYLLTLLAQRQPASLRSVALLLREAEKMPDALPDYVGFRLPHRSFVVGYGIDQAQQYRHLPFIGTLKSTAPGPEALLSDAEVTVPPSSANLRLFM